MQFSDDKLRALRDYPWGQLAANIGVMSGMGALGYITAGLGARAVQNYGYADRLARHLSPTQQAALVAGVATATGAGAAMATRGARNISAQLVARRLEARRSENEKVAHICDVYLEALALNE